MATRPPLRGKRARLMRRALRTLPEIAGDVRDWRPARSPAGNPAVACTPLWAGAPREILFWGEPDGRLGCSAQFGGARGKYARIDADGSGWATPVVPLGDPGRN